MQYLLYAIRKENKVTQKQMAGLLNIHVNTYREKEKGLSQFNQDEMFMIADFFGKGVQDIFLPREHQIGNKENV